ncbi:MAG: chromate transporter [Bacteroidales bacterium]|nr:chromate transporter [Bacteroidales bacterium]
MTGLLGQLFITFFLIGLFNFGGGGAMLSLIQGQVVTARGWISQEMFTDIVGISQSTPGPIGINCATYVGYEVMQTAGFGTLSGVLGSVVATFAVVLPSFFVFFLIIRAFNKFHESRAFADTMRALRPAVAGLIGAAALVLIVSTGWNGVHPQLRLLTENFPDWKAWVLFAAAFALGISKKAGPIAIILGAGVVGLLIY